MGFIVLLGVSVVFPFLVLLVLCIACIYVTGCAPRCVLSLEARLFRAFKKRKKWSWTQIEAHVFLGSLPRWPEHLAELRGQGVGAVLALNETWELALSITCVREECGMVVRQLPTPDFFAPTQRDLVEAVAFIVQHAVAGRGVYVHCNGGKGRSTACVICYLMYVHGLSAEDAFDLVRAKRKVANLRALCGLRTQWRAIKSFEREMRAVRADLAARGFRAPPAQMAVRGAKAAQVAPLPPAACEPSAGAGQKGSGGGVQREQSTAACADAPFDDAAVVESGGVDPGPRARTVSSSALEAAGPPGVAPIEGANRAPEGERLPPVA